MIIFIVRSAIDHFNLIWQIQKTFLKILWVPPLYELKIKKIWWAPTDNGKSRIRLGELQGLLTFDSKIKHFYAVSMGVISPMKKNQRKTFDLPKLPDSICYMKLCRVLEYIS